MTVENFFSTENNQVLENKERMLEIKEAEIEDIDGITSVLEENLLPKELLDKEKRDVYLKNSEKTLEDFSKEGFLVKQISKDEIGNTILDKKNHITLTAKENNEVVGYALTYNLEKWRQLYPEWEKVVELFNEKEREAILESKDVLYFRHIATKKSHKNKGLGVRIEYKVFAQARQKQYNKVIGEILDYPIKNEASIKYNEKIGFKKVGITRESKNDLVWGLYKKGLEEKELKPTRK